MKNLLSVSAILMLFGLLAPAKTTHKPLKTQPSTASKSHVASSHLRRSKRVKKISWKRHGQQRIDTGRAREIQQALIRENYLDGEPNGIWDSRTEAAMARYQSDHGWQSKVTPDSRALINLGLGPNRTSQILVPSEDKTSGSLAATVPAGAAPGNPNR